jgi:hypothetical protein
MSTLGSNMSVEVEIRKTMELVRFDTSTLRSGEGMAFLMDAIRL